MVSFYNGHRWFRPRKTFVVNNAFCSKYSIVNQDVDRCVRKYPQKTAGWKP